MLLNWGRPQPSPEKQDPPGFTDKGIKTPCLFQEPPVLVLAPVKRDERRGPRR